MIARGQFYMIADITSAGYSYDAAGNVTSDGFHTYTYDAEGNMTAVDGGSTAQYVYNALNQRVSETVGGTTTQFAYNVAGQRVSIWNTASPAGELQEEYYVGNRRVAYIANSALHFQHQDWTGTERMRTTFNGAVEGKFTSMSFGDAFATASGTDGDPYHYGMLDHDYSSDTDHAQFRQYSSTPGRWMSPDPYDGSYNPLDPQSLNRYSYVLNSPVSFLDPSGMCALTSKFAQGGVFVSNCAGEGAGGPGGSDDTFYTVDGPEGIYNYDALDYLSATGNGLGLGITTTDPGNLGGVWVSTGGSEYYTGVYISEDSTDSGNLPEFSFAPAPSKLQQAMAYIQGVSDDVRNCINNVALPTIANDLNPFSPSVLGILQQGTSDLSQSSLQAAAYYSVTSGLTVPLRSSIVRAGMTNAEALGKLSFAISLLQVDAALLDAVIQEYKHC